MFVNRYKNDVDALCDAGYPFTMKSNSCLFFGFCRLSQGEHPFCIGNSFIPICWNMRRYCMRCENHHQCIDCVVFCLSCVILHVIAYYVMYAANWRVSVDAVPRRSQRRVAVWHQVCGVPRWNTAPHFEQGLLNLTMMLRVNMVNAKL